MQAPASGMRWGAPERDHATSSHATGGGAAGGGRDPAAYLLPTLCTSSERGNVLAAGSWSSQPSRPQARAPRPQGRQDRSERG